MGLDVTAYSNLVKLADFMYLGREDDDLPSGVTRLYTDDESPDHADQITDGCYEYEGCHDFHVGSCRAHGEWLDDLIELAGYDKARDDINAGDGPFSELIDFSDCDGVIGVTHCRKLAKDFADYQPKADAREDEWFRKLYGEWRKAFELASDDGAVEFH